MAGIKNVRKYLTKNALRTVSDCGTGERCMFPRLAPHVLFPFLEAVPASGILFPELSFRNQYSAKSK
nr:hypothetical protein [Bacillaceae bacterium]